MKLSNDSQPGFNIEFFRGELDVGFNILNINNTITSINTRLVKK
jgi:hypothetical protein